MSRQMAYVLAKDFQCVWVRVGLSIAVRPDTLTHLSSAGVIRRIRILCTRLNAPRNPCGKLQFPCSQNRTKGETKSRSLSIYVAPVADPHDQNERPAILDLTDDPAVGYPITPKATEGTSWSFAYNPWIARTRNTPLHVIEDVLSHLPIQPAKLARCRLRVSNRPSQEFASLPGRYTPFPAPCGRVRECLQQGSNPPCHRGRAR